MGRKQPILLLLLVILFTGKLFSDGSMIGTTANNYLKILLPAEPAAMGGAYVALADDIHALSYNPAGIAKSMFTEASATHVMWFEQVLYDNLNFMMPTSAGNFGFAVNYLHMTPMDRTIASGSPLGYDTLYRFSPYSLAGTVSYATEFTQNMFVGASVSIQDFAIDPEDSSGSSVSFIADLGIIYDMDFMPGLSAGLSFRDLGPPSSFISESYMPPLNMRAGLGYDGGMFTVEADVEIINDNDINFFAGGSFTLADILTLRAGYKGGAINQPSFGAGLAYQNFFIDYAFIPFWEEDLGLTHRVTVTYKFGSPEAKITANPPVFSPNRDRVYDYTFITPVLRNENKVKKITLNVYDSFRAKVLSVPMRSPKKVFWNGVNDFKTVVPDGEYYISVSVDYGGGLKSESNLEKVEVDNTPPQIRIDANPKKVKPGQLTTLVAPVRFTPEIFDLHGTGKWQLVIRDSNNKVFKTFSGFGDPLEIIWDGTDNTGMNQVKTGAVYTYTMYASDTVGNWSRSRAEKVNVLQREVIITLDADTLFDPGKADVKIRVYKDLEKIAKKIKGYSRKSVRIVGHTDNRPVRNGLYRNNMELSEYRARAVAKFFVELFGIDPEVFTTEGRGDTEPIASNDTPEGRKKNRRVTIHLRASTWE